MYNTMMENRNEYMNANVIRELALNDLDAVTGGGNGGISVSDMTREEAFEFLFLFATPDSLHMVFSMARVIGFSEEVVLRAENDEAYTSMTHYEVIWCMVNRQYNH